MAKYRVTIKTCLGNVVAVSYTKRDLSKITERMRFSNRMQIKYGAPISLTFESLQGVV